MIDPMTRLDGVLDVRIESGRIAQVGSELAARADERVLDCAGKTVVPGLIDAHVHLREPGREDEETIESGSRAALAGGFTAILAMPNTDPVTDSQAAVGFIRAQAERAGFARVYPIAAATHGSLGVEMSEIGDLVAAGAVAITDDGRPISDAGLMRRILEYSTIFDIPVVQHCEDLALTDAGVMHEGPVSTRLGLKGIPAAAEEVVVARDLILAELTRAHYHVAHLSTARSAELVREAKRRGVRVTAEVTPHHLILTDEHVQGYDTQAKVNPPLRSARDVEVLREALADGTIDAVATDHAPHHYDEKEREFDFAPFGILGLETAFGLLHTYLVLTGRLSLAALIERMSCAPARIFHLPGGSLAPEEVADVSVLDLEQEWTVEPERFLSKSRNTPFAGRRLTGRPWMTIVGGRVLWSLEADETDSSPARSSDGSSTGERSSSRRRRTAASGGPPVRSGA